MLIQQWRYSGFLCVCVCICLMRSYKTPKCSANAANSLIDLSAQEIECKRQCVQCTFFAISNVCITVSNELVVDNSQVVHWMKTILNGKNPLYSFFPYRNFSTLLVCILFNVFRRMLVVDEAHCTKKSRKYWLSFQLQWTQSRCARFANKNCVNLTAFT